MKLLQMMNVGFLSRFESLAFIREKGRLDESCEAGRKKRKRGKQR